MFDQPLYVKMRDIIAGMDHTDIPLFVHISSFHTLMSFMGSIGFMMDGSRIKELLSTLFAPNSVKLRQAYTQAVRGHFLIHQALAEVVVSVIHSTESKKQHICDASQRKGPDL